MEDKNKNRVYETGLLIGALIFLSVFLFGVFLVAYNDNFSNTGAFGDSFGVLTSLFSGLAFVGLIVTIVMQKEELALQRQELKFNTQELTAQKTEMTIQNKTLMLQQFENTFFKTLETFQNLRNTIHITTSSAQTTNGTEAICLIYGDFKHRKLLTRFSEGLGTVSYKYNSDNSNIDGLNNSYRDFYKKYSDSLGPYYRSMYNALKLVKHSKNVVDDTKFYTNLLRAQLSSTELCLLFYNSISDYGEKMAPLVYEFVFLKHINIDEIPEEHINLLQNFKSSGRVQFSP
ncbi:putative phage abortive infection protein [Thalassotalea sp. 1_MG-2023]|uniref:putative phage abortive infection protein n=1 Tax=Thalassotalea sp. 1_MG-2023 TaxID=3062680 RepID=UPI0026E457EF|nr:putative phage abortive infection protein [Thalassotalea sp. 1_MG-2023]MDO6426833.1 putative phage abortive infection protein [Thalassotalea sp. 1_MG-2023]